MTACITQQQTVCVYMCSTVSHTLQCYTHTCTCTLHHSVAVIAVSHIMHDKDSVVYDSQVDSYFPPLPRSIVNVSLHYKREGVRYVAYALHATKQLQK